MAPGHTAVGSDVTGGTEGRPLVSVGAGVGGFVPRMVGRPEAEGNSDGDVATGDVVGEGKTGDSVGASGSAGAKVGGLVAGAEVGVLVGVGGVTGASVGSVVSTILATQDSSVAKTRHSPSQSPPKKHAAPVSSLNMRLPGASQNVDDTSLSTKFNVCETLESSSMNTTNDVSASRKQLC